jgi:hypothetical protein
MPRLWSNGLPLSYSREFTNFERAKLDRWYRRCRIRVVFVWIAIIGGILGIPLSILLTLFTGWNTIVIMVAAIPALVIGLLVRADSVSIARLLKLETEKGRALVFKVLLPFNEDEDEDEAADDEDETEDKGKDRVRMEVLANDDPEPVYFEFFAPPPSPFESGAEETYRLIVGSESGVVLGSSLREKEPKTTKVLQSHEPGNEQALFPQRRLQEIDPQFPTRDLTLWELTELERLIKSMSNLNGVGSIALTFFGGVLIFVGIREGRELLGFLVPAICLGLGLYLGFVRIRHQLLALKLRRDLKGGIVVLDDNAAMHGHASLEVLPFSKAIWTINGQPGPIREFP